MNHWTGGGVRSVVRLRGDNSGFEGNPAVHGMLRLIGERSLPAKINMNLVIDNGSSIDVTALDESVWKIRRDEVITVLSWSGSVSGADLAAINVSGLPRGWSFKVNPPAQEARLAYAAPGSVILAR